MTVRWGCEIQSRDAPLFSVSSVARWRQCPKMWYHRSVGHSCLCLWWLNLMVKWDQVLETMKSVHYSCCVCISCFIFWSLKFFFFLSHSSWTQLVLYYGQLVQQSTFSRRLCDLLPATTSRDLGGLHGRLLPTLSDQNRVLWWKHMLDCTTSFKTLTRMQKQERNQEALTWRRLQTSTYCT